LPLPNPYAPGQLPRVLAGRAPERRRLAEPLHRVTLFGEFGGPPLTLHAPRGMGKTSLLRATQDDARASGFVTAWAAVAGQGPLLAELVRSIERAVASSPALETTQGRRWRARLEKVTVEVGLPGLSVAAELGRNEVSGSPRPPVAPVAAMEDLLHETAELIRANGGAGLAVFVDEIHAARRVELAVLLNALQNLDGDRANNPVAFFAAGLPSTPEHLTKAATFGERGTFLSLHRLDATDSAVAIADTATPLKVAWEPDALRQVVADADGYPHFLQLLGWAAWHHREPEAGDVIALRDLRGAYPHAAEQLATLYRARWSAASPGEQDFMAAMAASGAAQVTRAEIAAALGKDSQTLGVPRGRLIEKGIIESVGHGRLQFTLPGFAAYVSVERGLETVRRPEGDTMAAILRRNLHPDR
jgi:hypothetical protein